MDIKAKPFIRMVFLCLLFVGAYGFMSKVDQNYACASSGAPTTPCDPEYMDALEARAWLEAQREISQNQNLIVKPDSVLEYTCFNRFLWEIGDDAINQFSETQRWGEIPGLESTTQDSALGRLILTGLVSYIEENFPHRFLGGRAADDTIDYVPGSGNGDHILSTNAQAPSSYTYTCNRMRIVWEAAKCMNFFDRATAAGPVTENHDGFYDFRWYNTNDPRQLPTGSGFAACTIPAGDPYNFAEMEPISFNTRQDMYVLATENPNDATAYNRDNLVTFLDFILPVGVAPTTACITTPIQTGIQVNRRMSGGQYPDAVCPNPGCYLTANGASCE